MLILGALALTLAQPQAHAQAEPFKVRGHGIVDFIRVRTVNHTFKAVSGRGMMFGAPC
jgi:hypothetical protein